MYMNPTLSFGGSLWFIHAVAHSMAFWSPHIGSGPGVAGLSGMQVKLLLPCRTVLIWPPASMLMIVASLAMAGGAADIALLTMSSSDIAVILCSCAVAEEAMTTRVTVQRA